eukprot:44954-Amphidinium_carterae.1
MGRTGAQPTESIYDSASNGLHEVDPRLIDEALYSKKIGVFSFGQCSAAAERILYTLPEEFSAERPWIISLQLRAVHSKGRSRRIVLARYSSACDEHSIVIRRND